MQTPVAPPAYYCKRPVLIEAAQVPPVEDIDARLVFENWINPRRNGHVTKWSGGGLKIETLEGVMMANPGDYVICGVRGELYPCKPEIFEATYEPVK